MSRSAKKQPVSLHPTMEKRVRKILSKYGKVVKTTPFPAVLSEQHKIFAKRTNGMRRFEDALFHHNIFVITSAYHSYPIGGSPKAVSRVIIRAIVTECSNSHRTEQLAEIFSWDGVKMLDDYLKLMVIFKRLTLMEEILDPSQLQRCVEIAKEFKMEKFGRNIAVHNTPDRTLQWFTVESILSPSTPSTLFDAVPTVDGDGRVVLAAIPKDIVRLIDAHLSHPDDVYTIELQICGTLVRRLLGTDIERYNMPVIKARVLAHFIKTFGTSLKAESIVAHTSKKNLWDVICDYGVQLETILGIEHADDSEFITDFFEQHFTPKEYQLYVRYYVDGPDDDEESDDEDEEDIDEDE